MNGITTWKCYSLGCSRVIALENLIVALLAEASDRQLALAHDMAAYTPRGRASPRMI